MQRSCLQHLLEKSRDAILIQESLALIRKPKQSVTIQPRKLSLRWQHRRLGRPSTQPRPTAHRPPSGLSRSTPCVIACGICAAPCRPMPPPSRRPLCPPSHGQCFDVEALVCVVLNTNPCHRLNVPQRTTNLTNPPHQITNHHAVAQCSPPAFFYDSREIRRKR